MRVGHSQMPKMPAAQSRPRFVCFAARCHQASGATAPKRKVIGQ